MAAQKKNTRLAQTLPNVAPRPATSSPFVTPAPFQFIPQIDMLGQATNIPTTYPAAPGLGGGAGGGVPSSAAPQQPVSMSPYLDDENPDYQPPLLPSPQLRMGYAPSAVAGEGTNLRGGQDNNNQTNQPTPTGSTLGYDQSSLGWNTDAVANFRPDLQGTQPDFTGGLAQNFTQQAPPTPYGAPQEQYDPKRAQEIMRALSFMPAISLLGGDFGYAQRLMPSLAAQAIGGDKAYFDEGQALNQKFLAGKAKAQQQDIANQVDFMKLGQAESEDFTKRQIAMATSRMAEEELKQKTMDMQERMLSGLRGSEMEREKIAMDFQNNLSLLTPEAQLQVNRNMLPAFRAFFGVGLPKDEAGNYVPLQRANPNEPTEKMMKQKLLDNLIDGMGKNPEFQTPEGQLSGLTQINYLMADLGYPPEFRFTRPLTANQSPTQRAQLGLDARKVATGERNAQTEAQRAATYAQSVANQYQLGKDKLKLDKEAQAYKEKALTGAYGPAMKMAGQMYNAQERIIANAAAKINSITGAKYDTMLSRLTFASPEAQKKLEPLVRPFMEQLTRAQEMSAYYSKILLSGAAAAGGGAPTTSLTPPPPSTGIAPPQPPGAVDPAEQELKSLLLGG